MVDHAPDQPYTCLYVSNCFDHFQSSFQSPNFQWFPIFASSIPRFVAEIPGLPLITYPYISPHVMVKTCGKKRQFHGKFSGFHHEKNLKSQSSPRFGRFPQPSPPSPPWRPRPRRPRCGTRSDAGRCCGGIRSCSGCGERMDGACRHAEELGKQIGWEDV